LGESTLKFDLTFKTKSMSSKLDWLNNLASSKIKYNLGAGVPPISLYPDFNPAKLFGVEKLSSNDESINYHSTAGYINETAARFIYEEEGIEFDPNDILITNGVQEAISLTIACFKNKTLACIDPVYPGFEDAAKLFDCKLIKFPYENWLKNLETLEEGSLFYLSSDFSNPLGYTLTLNERKQLVELSVKNKFYIFDDATYRPFFLDQKLPPLISFNQKNIIHAFSFSKILAPGLRTAFIYLPKELSSKFTNIKSNLSLNNSGITQKIVKQWLIENNYSLTNHLAKFKNRLNENRKITRKFNLNYEGGFFSTIQINHKADFDFCNSLLMKEQIATIPFSLFTENKKFENQLRICISNIDFNDLSLVLEIIKNFTP
jgi:DNA-binding transcriptional MocR family regulator